jgi:DNA-binding transcriptional LysR family regulator
MDRDILSHLPVVAAVARLRSFARAGAELGLSPSAVSHAVRLVEDRLKTPIFTRTTRSISLTESGESFLARAVPALAEISEAAEAVQAQKGNVTGTLRINAPTIAVPMVLTGLMATLAQLYPNLVIDVTTDDALTDIVAQGFDAGIRLGEMIAQDMVAVRLTAPFRAIMVASPDYLAASGEPFEINDLQRHNCINYRQISTGGTYAWDLSDKGNDVRLAVRGTARVSESLFAISLALVGVGIAYVFEPLVRKHIAEGRLRWLLPETAIEEPGLFLYFPRRTVAMPKLRAFVDEARRALSHG